MAIKRRVTRQATLPSCRCELDELEALENELSKILEEVYLDRNVAEHIEPPEVHFLPALEIKVTLENEQLEFSRFAELRAYKEIPSTLRGLEMAMYNREGNRVIKVGAAYPFGFSVRAIGDNPAWCAGAIEIVREFAKRHHRWYYGPRMLIVTIASLELLIIFPFRNLHVTKDSSPFVQFFSAFVTGLLGMLFVGVVLIALWLKTRPMAFEPFVVRLKQEEAFWRRYDTEILLSLTAIPALAIIGSLVVALYNKIQSP